MTLNSEGLEKAAEALAKIYHGEGDEPFHLMVTTAISAYLSALPPVDGLEVVGHVKPEHPDAVEPLFVRELSQPWMEGIFAIPVVTLSQASSVIAGLKEVNEALMRERTSLIETKREQIERLTKERDGARKAFDGLSATTGKIAKERSSIKEEIKRLTWALNEIEELNLTAEDENGHRWANSEMIVQTITLARPTKEDHNG